MRPFIFLALSCLFVFACNPSEKKTPVSVIFDTDMGPDFDDVGALAVLHALADSGEAKILATVSSNMYEYSVPCIEVINTYFNHADLLVGAPKQGVTYTDQRFFGEDKIYWAEQITAQYPHKIAKTADAPDAVEVYRRVLSVQPDTSVNIITVGFFTNLAALLKSKPDQYSELDGMALVKKKVRRLVSMAGIFPQGREFNVRADSTSSVYVFHQWPTPVLLSGFEIGVDVKTGAKLVSSNIIGSPVKDSYQLCLNYISATNHNSWDQTAVLVGVRGPSKYFGTVHGRIIVEPSGRNTWQDDPNGLYERLVWKMNAEQIGQVIDDLMVHQPISH